MRIASRAWGHLCNREHHWHARCNESMPKSCLSSCISSIVIPTRMFRVSTDHHSRNFTVYVRVILELNVCFGQQFLSSDVSGCLGDQISKITYYWSDPLLGPWRNNHAGILPLGNYLITIKMQHNTNLQRISQPPRTVNNLSLRCFLQSSNVAYLPHFASFDLDCMPIELSLT